MLASRIGRAEPKREGAVAPDFHPVVKHGHADGAAPDGVVAVAQRVDQCFTQGGGGEEQFVNALESARLEPSAQRKVAVKEGHRIVEQGERVAFRLAVVEELGLVSAFEAGQAELALRIAEDRRFAEQDDRGVEDLPVLPQGQPV